jgi:PAS domain S-box-containing protein
MTLQPRRLGHAELEFLAAANRTLSASLDYETTLVNLARLAVPELADWCAVDMLAPDGAIQRLAMAHVEPAKMEWASDLDRRYPQDPNGPVGVPRVLRTGQPEFYPEITDEMLAAVAYDAEHLAAALQIGFRSVLIVPLTARGRTLGAITFVATDESGRRYGPDDRALAEALAERAALAVDNARLYQEAQQALRAHRESEERLRGLIESSFVGILLSDFDGGIVEANDAFLEMVDYTREDLLAGQVRWDEMTPPEQRHLNDRAIEQLKATGVCPPFEKEYIRKDGSRVPVLLGSSLLKGSERYIVSYVLDISERKRAEAGRRAFEEALRHREREFASLVESSPDIISRFDHDLRCRYISPAVRAVVGMPPQFFIGKTHAEMGLPPETCDRAEEALRRIFATGRMHGLDFSLPSPAGARFFEASGVPLFGPDGSVESVMTVSRDVTDRRRAMEALKESEKRFEIMANAAPVLIWMSAMDAQCTYFNRSWLNFTGRTMEQEIGQGWTEGVHPDDRERCLCTYHSSFEAREPFEMELRLRRRDGEYRWIMDIGTPRFLDGERFAGYIGSCIDITERRQAEQALLENEARQRTLLRDVLKSVTEGKLILCQSAGDLPPRAVPVGEPIPLSMAAFKRARRAAQAAAAEQGLEGGRIDDLITATSEAAMNAVVHGGGGTAFVGITPGGAVQVWVEDGGTGIELGRIPQAIEKGASTAGSLGHGFFLMLQSVDRLFLLTGPSGTTIVIEQERVRPEPAWLADR